MSSEIGRNMKCPCNSGKKYKRCCLNKISREQSLVIDLPEGSRPAGLVFRPDGISVVDSDGLPIQNEAYVESYYAKSRKNKVLHKIRVGVPSMHIDINQELLRYDNFACVDTNTKKSAEHGWISVSGVVFGFYNGRTTTRAEVLLSRSCGFEFRGLTSTEAERHGLRLLLTVLQRDEKFRGKTGVIVDHDMARIFRINRRQEPIIDDFFLPAEFELIYATADSGMEFPCNRMIKDADKFAGRLMSAILTDDEARYGLHMGADEFGVPFSQWIERTIQPV